MYRKVCGSSATRSAYSRFTMTLTCRLLMSSAGRQRLYASSVLPAGRVAWPDGPTTCGAMVISAAKVALLFCADV